MRSRAIRPAPEWRVTSSSGTEEPVRMNCPATPRSSTSLRTWFHIAGASRPSSIRRGGAPKQQGRLDPRQAEGVGVGVGVQPDGAGGVVQARRGLAACARSLDHDGAQRREDRFDLTVNHPRAIPSHDESPTLARRSAREFVPYSFGSLYRSYSGECTRGHAKGGPSVAGPRRGRSSPLRATLRGRARCGRPGFAVRARSWPTRAGRARRTASTR